MFKRINGFVVHVPTQYKTSSKELQYYQRLTGKKAKCEKCGAILKAGNYLDHHFPYEVQGNRCKKCYSSEN